MLVLVIDTSSEAVTAAVVEVRDGQVIAPVVEEALINARGHGELLAPEIQRALDYHDATVADLGAIVAGTGPGPYTGLRVGLVTAAVMGEALGIPTYGVCSLDGIAADDRMLERSDRVLVVTDARRKEVYWALYDGGARIAGPDVAKPADVPTDGTEELAGAGAALYDFSYEWTSDGRGGGSGGSGTRSGYAAVRYPSATGLVRCALDRIVEGAPSEQLTPLYLRRPDAVAPGTPKPVSR